MLLPIIAIAGGAALLSKHWKDSANASNTRAHNASQFKLVRLPNYQPIFVADPGMEKVHAYAMNSRNSMLFRRRPHENSSTT